MSEERITVPASRKGQLAKLASALGELGFTSITYTNERLVVERVQGEDLKGKPNLDYRITFLESTIEMVYGIPPNVSKRVRMLELLPVLMNVLTLSEDYYEVKPSAIFSHLIGLLSDISKVVGRDAVELSAELEELKAKADSLNARYQDLVGSSEENARILLECERRRDELRELLEKLRAMSDERLREELYNWLKMHNGDIDIMEFGKASSVPPGRVEDGLNMLIKEGYIKRKVE
jgi:hypothetical protein